MQTNKAEGSQTKQKVVEVFKTNVGYEVIALQIITTLQRVFPTYGVNFDLDDCDKILRVESKDGYVEVEKIMGMVRSFNRHIEMLQ